MQILKKSPLDVLKGISVITHEVSASQVKNAQSGTPNNADSFAVSDANRAKNEVSEWMKAVSSLATKSDVNKSAEPGVVKLENAQIPLSSIPDYSGLLGDKSQVATVSGTLDASSATLRDHHNIPQFHLETTAPSQQPNHVATMEYWSADATDNWNFVGTVYRTEAENHATIQSETVARPDQSITSSFTRPWPG